MSSRPKTINQKVSKDRYPSTKSNQSRSSVVGYLQKGGQSGLGLPAKQSESTLSMLSRQDAIGMLH